MNILLIGRGISDWHCNGIDNDGNKCSSTGGSLQSYLDEANDGVPIYDAFEADTNSFIQLICHGPMCEPSLPQGMISKFANQDALARMKPGLQGSFRPIAYSFFEGLTSLDYVATDVYLDMLRFKVNGVKIGCVKGKQAIWEPLSRLYSND